MGTNFYFKNIKSQKEANEFNAKLENLTNEFKSKLLELGCDEDKIRREINDIVWSNELSAEEIHIGKRSMGWKPIFQTQFQYEGIKGMKKWYEENKDEWCIVNEYGEEFTWEQLLEELIYWNKDNKNAKSHLNNDELYCNYFLLDGVEWTDGEFS